ncbi:hypothetical protein [Emticicia sp. C21]|uniref:hypothetical protein n=1 Tax=Emticicia sp. C21 TaxID=2302915 RepID=UPI000E3516C0|nr:hypothetical protein [Emticicia sp. C21]RFS15731.1 hypothetical protein D0T08_16465 [Emticicia sp. C21]
MKEDKYVIREPLKIGKELADIKVTNIVGTFLNEDRDSFQKIRFMNTKKEPKKVANMVGTFLNEDRDSFQKIRL